MQQLMNWLEVLSVFVGDFVVVGYFMSVFVARNIIAVAADIVEISVLLPKILWISLCCSELCCLQKNKDKF